MSGDNGASIIHYLYRDAGNYKCWGEFVVSGAASRAEIQQHLIDREFFLPMRIGVPTLLPAIRNEDDHELHSIEEIEVLMSMPSPALMSYAELLRRLRHANALGWF